MSWSAERKNSVPLSSVRYWLAGEFAGHTVNPGLSAAAVGVSNSTTVTNGPPTANSRLEKAIDNCKLEFGTEERVLIGRYIEPMGIGPDMRIIAKTGPEATKVIRGTICAVILSRQPVNGPGAKRAGGMAHGNVNVVGATEITIGKVSSVAATWNQR